MSRLVDFYFLRGDVQKHLVLLLIVYKFFLLKFLSNFFAIIVWSLGQIFVLVRYLFYFIGAFFLFWLRGGNMDEAFSIKILGNEFQSTLLFAFSDVEAAVLVIWLDTYWFGLKDFHLNLIIISKPCRWFCCAIQLKTMGLRNLSCAVE